MMDSPGTEHYVEELYFLITKFLETGPCKQTLQKLKEEIAKYKIIPKRLDWEGNEHEQTFEELENKYPHIAPRHLLDICKRIGPILDKEVLPCAPGVKTLLGAGTQSLLRNKDVVKRYLRLSEYLVRHHGRSIYSPISCHNHNIVQVLFGQEISGPACRRQIFSPRLYSRTHLLNRTLGHLTAVYCLLFDQTGKFVITGADDLLIKVWSVIDGRLLCTLRGASAEITDIAINAENTLLAAGSLDKAIRVWCLQTSYPIATLLAHTGMITGVNFCPNPFNDNRYLVSTSTDGSVAFWSYTEEPVLFQSKPVLYNEKIRPGQAQMICSSFSYGGAFLATGSADHHVRVYSMAGNPPHRILEKESHSDRVDSLLWANRGLKFISGSKDGSAIIWHFKAQTWHTRVLDMSTVLPGSVVREDDSKMKLKVTMVCWSCDDSLAITSVNNFLIKIWTSSGKLLRELKEHRDVVYVLEFHPLDPAILMSAGHDGTIFFWDLRNGEQLFMHQNHIEGQGHGAIFDAKWSPDGTMVAATDSHGHLLLFGIAEYNKKMESLPKELFFHTDYRPLVRDNQNQVLDEQTQMPPHLMPPPFLVDIDGNPYPPHLQRLVPGREDCTVDQLIPNIIYTAGGNPEVVQFVNDTRTNLDRRIEELAQQANSVDTASRNETSPVSRVVRRGEVEGSRQSIGSRENDGFLWRKKTLISPLSSGTLATIRARNKFFGNLESEEYEAEKKREVEEFAEIQTTTSKKPKRKLLHNYRTRAARNSNTQQPAREEGSEGGSDGHSSDVTGLSDDISSSSEASSSEYSDWVAEHSVNLEPPQRSRRQRKRKPPQHTAESPPSPAKSQQQEPSTEPSTSTAPSTSKKRTIPPPEIVTEIPELYRPSEWLSEVIPKKFPYYPQMGDEVMFFAQGYELYLKAVTDRAVYKFTKTQSTPWGNLQLQEPELVKVIGIKYELRPPRLCCLRLAVMKENGSLTNDRFTIKYHDVPDVIDFFVLKQTYDTAMMRNWKIGDRFRSMIDDGWWWGVIEGRRPHADSAFLCHRIRWDNGETEDMSPWDMEPIDPAREPDKGGSVPVLPEEIAAILYHPRADEWPGGDRESYCRKVLAGLEDVMGLAIAEPFSAPVDINVYKSYALVVEFPIDLSTIKARMENRFYRRLTAAQFDIRCLATNAEKFNESHSVIVKNARIVTDLCLKICKETELVDVSGLYRQLMEAYESSDSADDGAGPSTSRRERAAANRSLRAMRRANHLQPDWRRDCRQLLEVLWSCQDSEPFRGPVDRLENPDYQKVITTPIDLGQIREELKGNNYASPIEFCKDIRLIFSNSRQYNTNKRSKIYVMTVRLAAMAEEHMKRIIKDWKTTSRKQDKSKINGLRSRLQKSKSEEDTGGSADENSVSSSSDEPQIQPSYSQVPNSNRLKRIKVLLPKTSENRTTNTVYNDATNSQVNSKTRSTNESRRPVRYEDNIDSVRPLRLRAPIMKKLNHFVSTSETDSSSQPSTASSGHRSLRATKAVSYAEHAGDDSSGHSSTEGNRRGKSQPYNMRSSGGLKTLLPSAPKVNYNESSSSETEGSGEKQSNKSDNETGTEDDGNKSGSDIQERESSDPELPHNTLAIRVNGINRNKTSHPPPPDSQSHSRGGAERATSASLRSSVREAEVLKNVRKRDTSSESSSSSVEEEDTEQSKTYPQTSHKAMEDSWEKEENSSGEESNESEKGGRQSAKDSENRNQPSWKRQENNSEEDDESSDEDSEKSMEVSRRLPSRESSRHLPRRESARSSQREHRRDDDDEDYEEEHGRERLRRGSRKRKRSTGTESSESQPLRRSGRARQPLKRNYYTYASDSSRESSDQSEPASPRISISSRGRVRKITPRARAYLLD